jgi:hypothetical protein
MGSCLETLGCNLRLDYFLKTRQELKGAFCLGCCQEKAGQTEVRQRLFGICTQFNKSSTFCSEYLLGVVGAHAQAAN